MPKKSALISTCFSCFPSLIREGARKVGEHWKPISRKGGLLKVRDKRTGKIRYGFITTINGVKRQKTCFLNEKDAEHALATLKLKGVLGCVAPPAGGDSADLSIARPDG